MQVGITHDVNEYIGWLLRLRSRNRE